MDLLKALAGAAISGFFVISSGAYADDYMRQVCDAYQDPAEREACLNPPKPKSKGIQLEDLKKPVKPMCGDFSCDTVKLWRAAEDRCPEHIERLAKMRYEWTSGNAGMKFQIQPFDTDQPHVKRMTGYRLKIQSEAGSWSDSGYYCDIDSNTGKVVDFGLIKG